MLNYEKLKSIRSLHQFITDYEKCPYCASPMDFNIVRKYDGDWYEVKGDEIETQTPYLPNIPIQDFESDPSVAECPEWEFRAFCGDGDHSYNISLYYLNNEEFLPKGETFTAKDIGVTVGFMTEQWDGLEDELTPMIESRGLFLRRTKISMQVIDGLISDKDNIISKLEKVNLLL